MCKGSVFAKKSVDARAGETYQVTDGGHHGFRIGVLHRENEGRANPDAPIACAACIRAPTTIQLTGLTPRMQQLYGVKATASATFIPNEAAPHNMQDVVEFENGVGVPLIDFADSTVRVAIAVPSAARQETRELEEVRA